MTKKIKVFYFPSGLRYSSPLAFGAGIYLSVLGYHVWGLLVILLGAIILTTAYITEIDLNKKSCYDYLFFLGMKLNGESKQFNSVDRIVIVKGNYSQTINTRAQSRQMDWSDYTGTLLLDNDTLDLLTMTNKRELLVGLKEFADFLQVPVEDRTTSEYFWIDMSKV